MLRFLKKPIAVIAEREAMFMQISISDNGEAALRFLWLTGNSISQYQYTSLIFGAPCSPTIAIFALIRSAENFAAGDVATKS